MFIEFTSAYNGNIFSQYIWHLELTLHLKKRQEVIFGRPSFNSANFIL